MIEYELLTLIGLVTTGLLIAIYGWMVHSPKFDKLIKTLEYKPTEADRLEQERKELEKTRKDIEAKRRNHYE